jgi:hypothetical protein
MFCATSGAHATDRFCSLLLFSGILSTGLGLAGPNTIFSSGHPPPPCCLSCYCCSGEQAATQGSLEWCPLPCMIVSVLLYGTNLQLGPQLIERQQSVPGRTWPVGSPSPRGPAGQVPGVLVAVDPGDCRSVGRAVPGAGVDHRDGGRERRYRPGATSSWVGGSSCSYWVSPTPCLGILLGLLLGLPP